MKTLDEIKEEVALDDNFNSWQILFESCAMYDYGRLEKAIKEIAKRYATEYAKEALRLSSENATIVNKFGNDIGYYTFDSSRNKIWVNKQSILHESNLPKHR